MSHAHGSPTALVVNSFPETTSKPIDSKFPLDGEQLPWFDLEPLTPLTVDNLDGPREVYQRFVNQV